LHHKDLKNLYIFYIQTDYAVFPQILQNNLKKIAIEYHIDRLRLYTTYFIASVCDNLSTVIKKRTLFIDQTPRLGIELGKVFISKEFSDVILDVEDIIKIRAHKMILVARTKYFEGMLNFSNGKLGDTIKLYDILSKCDQPQDLEAFVYFLYTDQLDTDLDGNKLLSLVGLSNCFLQDSLNKLAVQNVIEGITNENVDFVLQLAINYQDNDLQNECIRLKVEYDKEKQIKLQQQLLQQQRNQQQQAESNLNSARNRGKVQHLINLWENIGKN